MCTLEWVPDRCDHVVVRLVTLSLSECWTAGSSILRERANETPGPTVIGSGSSAEAVEVVLGE